MVSQRQRFTWLSSVTGLINAGRDVSDGLESTRLVRTISGFEITTIYLKPVVVLVLYLRAGTILII